jgi:putative protease
MGKEDLKKSTMKSKKILGHPLVSRIPVKSAKNTHSKKVLSLGSPEKAKTVRKKPGILIGEVTHYFAKIQVCVVKVLQHNISLEDKVRILGKGTDFVQVVKSLQIESEDVRSAKKGQLVGLKVTKEVKVGNKVYKAT